MVDRLLIAFARVEASLLQGARLEETPAECEKQRLEDLADEWMSGQADGLN